VVVRDTPRRDERPSEACAFSCRHVRAEQRDRHIAPAPRRSALQQWEGGSWVIGFMIRQLISKLVRAPLRSCLSSCRIPVQNGVLSFPRSIGATNTPPGPDRPKSP
jgi:hypothetical protein